jgi:hypothetical protein
MKIKLPEDSAMKGDRRRKELKQKAQFEAELERAEDEFPARRGTREPYRDFKPSPLSKKLEAMGLGKQSPSAYRMDSEMLRERNSNAVDNMLASKETPSDDYTTGQLALAAKNKDLKKTTEILNSPSYTEHKLKPNSHEEITLAVRLAIENKDLEMIKLLDEKFNLDNANDQKTIFMAAGSTAAIWQVFSDKNKALGQSFGIDYHPLVAAFGSGDLETATLLKLWADKNNVPIHVKNMAIQNAARKGHTDACKLYSMSDPYLSGAIKLLVNNGHGDKVSDLTRRVTEKGLPANDISYNNFEMLKHCSGHANALEALIRHPTVQLKVNSLPTYYQAFNHASHEDYKQDMEECLMEHTKWELRHAADLRRKGINSETAMQVAVIECAEHMNELLASRSLHPTFQF